MECRPLEPELRIIAFQLDRIIYFLDGRVEFPVLVKFARRKGKHWSGLAEPGECGLIAT